MRKVAASLVCLAFAGSTALAGTVQFAPAAQGVEEGTPAVFAVSISAATMAQFDTVFLVVGSDDGLPLNFEYAQSFKDLTTLDEAAPSPFSIFASDLAFGGNRFANPAFTAPLLIGTLTVDTTGLAVNETYEVFVSSQRETDAIGGALSLLAMGTNQETLGGSGSFTIVPEPATLIMLGLGGVAAAYRRRK